MSTMRWRRRTACWMVAVSAMAVWLGCEESETPPSVSQREPVGDSSTSTAAPEPGTPETNATSPATTTDSSDSSADHQAEGHQHRNHQHAHGQPHAPTQAEPVNIEPQPASNRAMADWLLLFAGNSDNLTQYWNDRLVSMIEQRLETSPDDVQTRFDLAVNLMRAGETQRAIGEIEAILAASQINPMQLSPEHAAHPTVRSLVELLAIAHLRLAEQRNCLNNHSADSCIIPIQGQGFHVDEDPSQGAMRLYSQLLQGNPDDLRHRWLLNLAAMTVQEYPDSVPTKYRIDPSVFESSTAFPRFRDVAMERGVAVMDLSGGTAMDDFNGDGHLDIVATSWGPRDQMRYFENDGRGHFTDRTTYAWLDGLTGGLNLIHGDYDNDGDLDLYVLRGAWLGKKGEQPNSLLQNDGTGRFTDVTKDAGVWSLNPSHTASFVDFDNDGWLDLFVANESRQGEPRPCELYHNQGDGTFRDVAAEVGVNAIGFIKGCAWGDIDNDGDQDLFLSRLYQTNALLMNNGPADDETSIWSRFSEATDRAGLTEPIRSFPCWFFDYDNDGHLDLLVASFAEFQASALDVVVKDYLGMETDAERTRLFRNRGDGTFDDVSEKVGVDKVLLVMGANFGDLDADGFLDIYLGTGEPSMSTLVPNVAFRNVNGERFEDVTFAGGFGNLQKGHGVSFGDFDGDGDEDIYAVMGGAYSGDVYPNILLENPTASNHWVTIRLLGTQTNRTGIGARIRVLAQTEDGVTRMIHRTVTAGGSFGSSSIQQEIGLGNATAIESIKVYWPGSGKTVTYRDVPVDTVVVLDEADETVSRASAQNDEPLP